MPSATLMLLLNEDIVVGFMGIFLHNSPVSVGLSANENYWYVLPKHRGASSLRLLKAAKKWAKDAGALHITMSASKLASDQHDKVCKIYEKDMKHFETTYIMEL